MQVSEYSSEIGSLQVLSIVPFNERLAQFYSNVVLVSSPAQAECQIKTKELASVSEENASKAAETDELRRALEDAVSDVLANYVAVLFLPSFLPVLQHALFLAARARSNKTRRRSPNVARRSTHNSNASAR